MKHRYCNLADLCAAAILAGLTATAGAVPIFTENFNSYSGNQNNTQYETGLQVAHTGSVTGWSKSGDGTMHAVDLSGAGNWAIMFWQNNVITQSTGIAANISGVTYQVDFDYGTAVYGTAQAAQATAATDGLLVEVLRPDNSVLASGTYTPGAWSHPSNANFSAGLHGTLQYVGDGSGVVKLRIGPAGTLDSGRFEGAIDNLTVAAAVDTTPAVVTLSPADGSGSVALNSKLTVTFDQPVQKGPGNIEIRKTGDDSLIEAIDVSSGLVTIADATVTIHPTANLPLSTGCYVLIPAASFTGTSGSLLPFGGITDKATWNFTTEGPILADARGDFRTTTADGTTADFNGGTGLSDTEGSGRWNYLNGMGAGSTLLSFGVAGNAGQSMYQTTGEAGGLPALGDQQIFGNVPAPAAGKIQWHVGATTAQSAVMRWTAGADATNLVVTGDIARGAFIPAWLDNTKFDILVNGVNQFTMVLNDSDPHTFHLTGLSVSAGQHVEFILSTPTGDNNGAIANLQATISGNLSATATPFATWADGAAFDDRNSEGIAYGMAWMLGAGTSTSPSVGLLPAVMPGSGLTMHFKRVHDQGPAKLYFQSSGDLSTWSDPGFLIPDNQYGAAIELAPGITATITEGNPDDVTVTVAPAGIGGGGSFFGRLKVTEN